jgi:hypothetical protein
MTNFPKTQAVRLRDEVICDLLERLCRVRALSAEESALLAKTMLRLGNKQDKWRWTRNEDKCVLRLMGRRDATGPGQPFTPNDDVRLLAGQLGRSEMAIYRRMERLRAKGIEPIKMFKREEPTSDLESVAWITNAQLPTP